MTAEQIILVKNSFTLYVHPNAEKVAKKFYDRLFQIDPKTKQLFTGDMEMQSMKLMQTLAVVVAGLDRQDEIVPAMVNLAKRHVNYGVVKEDYATVGQALLETLEMELGKEFTSDMKEAWGAAYALVTQVMTSVYQGA